MDRDPAVAAAPSERRRGRLFLGALLLFMLASLPFTVRDFWDARPDAARYLLAARSLLDGHGYSVMGEPFRLRPPGFSLLLAPLVAWRGYDFAALNLYVSLFGVLTVALLYTLVLPRLGPLVALAVGVLAWLNPQLQALSNQVLSDVPGLAFALLALLLLRWADARDSLARDLLVALAIAAAAYVRSANVLLAPAFVLDRLCLHAGAGASRQGFARFVARRVLLPGAAFVLLYLPWMLTPPAPSRYDSPDLQSYSTAFLRRDPNDPGAAALDVHQWRRRTARNGAAYAAIFSSAMVTRQASAATPVVATLGVLALLAVLLRRRRAPEWFALGTVLVLLAYYVPATRLLLPAYFLVIAAMAECACWLLGRAVAAYTAQRVVAAGLVLVAATSLGEAQRPDARAYYESLLAATQHVRDTVPADAALGGDVGAVYALLLDRPVYSLRPLSRRGKRKRLFELLEQRHVQAIVVRGEGPLQPVVKQLAAAGNQVVALPHHVVVYLTAKPN
jgi:hypothetical protein